MPIAVPAAADGGPRPVTVAVTYELDGDDEVDRRRTVVRTLSVPVSDADLLAVTATNTTYRPGTDGRLRVTVENVGDRRLTDIEPRLSTTPPFASDAPGAYVDSLAPGESRTVAFPVTVAGDAVASTHSLPVNVTARTADGDTVRSETRDVPVTIVDTDLLAVTGVNATVPPDTDGHLDVRIENVGSVPLTDLTPGSTRHRRSRARDRGATCHGSLPASRRSSPSSSRSPRTRSPAPSRSGSTSRRRRQTTTPSGRGHTRWRCASSARSAREVRSS
ncbi:COG1361 S-layer family protein [Halomicroarcula sp. GCM10025709]|uniref:COG1361 S-layer family protein n=1 Tax=Halomicroarcula sp. GCM10025709 TaxID=3252669 RepID=UPI00360A38E1